MVSGHKTKNLYIYASVNASTIIGKKKKPLVFVFLNIKKNTSLSNLSTLSVPDECYSSKASVQTILCYIQYIFVS